MPEVPKRRIESSIEIEALLESFREKLDADTAILYKYIDEEDIEGSEILQLLSKVSEFLAKDILDYEFKKIKGVKLSQLIKQYEEGTIYKNYEIDRIPVLRTELIKFVKVLRYCTHVDKDANTSKWKPDYKNRPPKYLVFNSEMLGNTYKSQVISGEGVTSAFCRLSNEKSTNGKNIKDIIVGPREEKKNCEEIQPDESQSPANNMYLSLSVDEIDKSLAHVKKSVDKNMFKNLGSHHAAWIILKKGKGDSEQVIGCLRFEFLSQVPQSLNENLREATTEGNIKLVVSVIENVLKKQKEASYKGIYKCLSPLLRKVIEIGMYIRNENFKAEKEKNPDLMEWKNLEKVHELIEHLYYVFKRNTYHGEDIIQRVNYFIEDLLDTLDLPKNIFGNVWENLRRHEDLLLYNTDSYRDHLMHQFHVFILGYLIIFSDIKQYQKLINHHYKRIINVIKHEASPGAEFSKLDILRIWALTALFHDSGYVFQRLPFGFKKFSKEVLGKELEPRFSWDKTLLSTDILITLSRITKYFVNCSKYKSDDPSSSYPYGQYSTLSETELLGILLQNAILENDHGVISAIILLKKHDYYKDGYKNIRNIEAIVNIAAISISLHNRPVIIDLSNRNNQRICMKSNPIAFLLVYCDNAQEWGRKESSLHEESSARPELIDIFFPGLPQNDQMNTDKKYFIRLDYRSESPGSTPDMNRQQEHLQPIINALRTPLNYMFGIDFMIRDNVFQSRICPFFMCGSGNNCPINL